MQKDPGVVTAGDIEVDSHVEIVNPEHVIATISGKASLNMQLALSVVAVTSRRLAISDEENRTIGRLQLMPLSARFIKFPTALIMHV